MEFEEAQREAQTRSMQRDYRDCGVHVNAVLRKNKDGIPFIGYYTLSDWHDGTTVATWVNGHERE